jgi:hypothetical protein
MWFSISDCIRRKGREVYEAGGCISEMYYMESYLAYVRRQFTVGGEQGNDDVTTSRA